MATSLRTLYGQRSPSAALRDLTDFPTLHRRLLDEYVRVLQEASTPRWSKWSEKYLGDPAPRTPYACRKLAEAHIRRRLLTLLAIYGQLSVIYDKPTRDQLASARLDCETFSGTLSAWRLPTVLAILPLVVGAVGQVQGALASVDVPAVIFATVGYLLYGAGLAFAFSRRAFRDKRKLFFPNAIAAEHDAASSGNDYERNVYRSERDLFEALGWAKPIEAPLDQIALALVTSAAALSILGFASFGVSEDHPGVQFGLAVAALVVSVLPLRLGLRRLGRRKWR